MTTVRISPESVIFTAATLAAVVGFLSSATLYSYAKWKVRPNRASLRCLYQYAAVFFAGTSLLCVDWMMADRAPIPLRPLLDTQARMGFAALMCVWSLMCLSGFMLQRTLRVIIKPNQTTPEGRNLDQAWAAKVEGRMHRGRITSRRSRRHALLAGD